ncbi:MAG: hypothetical protein ACE5IE_02805 [Dehalococcoidia bacterium]
MHLFGTGGIRGIIHKDITPELFAEIAKAVASTLSLGSRVCIATDTRVSRDILKDAIISGLLPCGISVTDLGILPTPALALLTRELGFDTGVMVTASHNPPEFNGIKLFRRDSFGYSREEEEEIERAFLRKGFRTAGWEDSGVLDSGDQAWESYFRRIAGSLPPQNANHHLKLLIDPGNGAGSGLIPDLFQGLGFDVTAINDEPDGLFPGRGSEPREDTLKDTVEFLKRKNADLAICFDGDADRVVFCDREGFLGYNEMIAVISRLVIKDSSTKKVATTVETGRLLDMALADLGADVVRGQVGDVNLAYLVDELHAPIGVEQVGVYIMPEIGHYPDSIFATLLLLAQISEVKEIRSFFQSMPRLFFQKTKIPCPDESKHRVMEKIASQGHTFSAGHINTTDGLRFEFEDSWMLIRASGTEPAIRVIAESKSSEKTNQLLSRGSQLAEETVKRLGMIA